MHSFNISLLGNLTIYYIQECQDLRDKLYTLLGMPKKLPEVKFPVDYSQPVSSVFSSIAKIIIEASQQLDILLNCQLESSQPPIKPSWALD